MSTASGNFISALSSIEKTVEGVLLISPDIAKIRSSSGDKIQPKTQIDASKEYVATKLKQKKDAEKAELENTSDSAVHNQQNQNTEQNLQNSPKTRESYVEKKSDGQNQGVKSTSSNDVNAPKTPEFVDNKTTLSEQSMPKSQVKTKESYMAQLRQERVEPKTFKSNTPKQNTHLVQRSRTNTKHTVKTKKSVTGTAKSSVKSGSVYSKKSDKELVIYGVRLIIMELVWNVLTLALPMIIGQLIRIVSGFVPEWEETMMRLPVMIEYINVFFIAGMCYFVIVIFNCYNIPSKI